MHQLEMSMKGAKCLKCQNTKYIAKNCTAAIIFDSMDVEDPDQFLKHLWSGGWVCFFCAIEH